MRWQGSARKSLFCHPPVTSNQQQQAGEQCRVINTMTASAQLFRGESCSGCTADAGSCESRLLLCCGCAPTGSVCVARVAAGLQPTAIGEVTILVLDPCYSTGHRRDTCPTALPVVKHPSHPKLLAHSC